MGTQPEGLYIPGLNMNRASDTYRGESKPDARDVHVIADQAHMRSDLSELESGEEEVAELRILLGRRRDLVIDQNRPITRLGEALLSLFPALDRVLDLNRRGPLTLLTYYQSPAQLRRAGHKRIAAYLRREHRRTLPRPGEGRYRRLLHPGDSNAGSRMRTSF